MERRVLNRDICMDPPINDNDNDEVNHQSLQILLQL